MTSPVNLLEMQNCELCPVTGLEDFWGKSGDCESLKIQNCDNRTSVSDPLVP